jgi:hypothetical protein
MPNSAELLVRHGSSGDKRSTARRRPKPDHDLRPKPDNTYIVEFKTADGEALAISVPAGETCVLKYFQERMRSVRAGCSLKEYLGLTISPGVLATADEVIE